MEAHPNHAPDQTPEEANDWLAEADRLLPGGLLGRATSASLRPAARAHASSIPKAAPMWIISLAPAP